MGYLIVAGLDTGVKLGCARWETFKELWNIDEEGALEQVWREKPAPWP